MKYYNDTALLARIAAQVAPRCTPALLSKIIRNLANIQVIKHGAGSYKVFCGSMTYRKSVVSVRKNSAFRGVAKWFAAADWDNYTASDPVMAYHHALEIAVEILAHRMIEDSTTEAQA
jgi:hypothetical protein